MLVAGDAGVNSMTNNLQFAVARLTPAGVLDNTFDGDGWQTINFSASDNGTCVRIDSQDRVLVAGFTNWNIGGQRVFAVARLTAGGSLDATFDG